MPTREAMLDFLKSGIKMMESDATRELLRDRDKVQKPGKKLIDLQLAGWEPLGYDSKVGCEALENVQGDEEIANLRMEFMFAAMRSYSQATSDRRPATLESKVAMPREVILEFFDICNTRMDLPETQEKFQKHLAETKQMPNKLCIQLQRDTLEDLGFEADHACQVLGRVPQDYQNDADVVRGFQMWSMKAKQTMMRVMKAHQDAGGELPQGAAPPEMGPDFKVAMEKARADLLNMSDDAKDKFLEEKLDETAKNRFQEFQELPPGDRAEWFSKLAEDVRLDFVKLQLLIMRQMQMRAMEQHQKQHGGGYAQPTAGPSHAPGQEQMM
eukprot:TRINITY_DN27327_c0_g1_i1.p1 TRINITY_DN27327_c0_g1~~TRINITY_DN27327_c0_g1_i1.p1  ORF type:complete len:348 (+),score=105.56 TRINITY_DN27327_c0_g1_i1:64-1044(+)